MQDNDNCERKSQAASLNSRYEYAAPVVIFCSSSPSQMNTNRFDLLPIGYIVRIQNIQQTHSP